MKKISEYEKYQELKKEANELNPLTVMVQEALELGPKSCTGLLLGSVGLTVAFLGLATACSRVEEYVVEALQQLGK